jgi:phosphate transport system permease protein
MIRLHIRKLKDLGMLLLMIGATTIVLVPLVLILFHTIKSGAGAISIDFFTQIPKPTGEAGGGMANGLVGSTLLLLLASAVGLPIGVLGAVFLAEFGGNRIATAIRFGADVLAGVPSIISGMVAYTLLVVPFKQFSALAGAVSLALIMIPIVLRTTEEQLKLVPGALREASLALGVPFWKTTLRVTLSTARRGILTGALLAVARVAGETAPLLFTALGNQFWSLAPTQPIAALPLQIFTFAISPYEDWHRLAWGGALVLTGTMLALSLTARLIGNSSRSAS